MAELSAVPQVNARVPVNEDTRWERIQRPEPIAIIAAIGAFGMKSLIDIGDGRVRWPAIRLQPVRLEQRICRLSALATRSMARTESGGFVQKKELRVASRLHQRLEAPAFIRKLGRGPTP